MNAWRCATTAAAMTVLSAGAAMGQLGYAGGTYGNTFDNNLATSGTNVAWTNNSVYTGWFLYRQDGANAPVAITTYNAGDGSTTNGTFYAFGTGTSTERALGGIGSGTAYFGSPASGAVAGWIAFAVTNNTTGVLTDFSVTFDGEQWRNSGNATAQTMVLEYGFGATFAAVTTWIAPGGNFDWTSPVTSTTAAAVDGNAAGLVAGRGGVISNLSWNINDTLWIRWVERNDSGNDHGMAIDRFFFSASSVPTPGAAALLGIGGLMVSRRRR